MGSGNYEHKRTLWTDERLDQLRKLCKEHTIPETAKLMGLQEQQVHNGMKYHGIRTGRTGSFQKGHISYYKGRKMEPERYEKSKHTMFKDGHDAYNREPLGTEKVRGDRHTYVKVGEPDVWQRKSRYIWEKHHGKLEPGDVVIFLNGDITDFRPENLMKVSKAEMLTINRLDLRADDTEFGRSKALIAKVITAKGKRVNSDKKS